MSKSFLFSLTLLITFGSCGSIYLKAEESADGPSKVSGIDRSLFSDAIAPSENFYLYANQKWLDQTEIPGDKSDYGIFTVLNDQTQEQVRDLIEEAAKEQHQTGSAAQKVGDLYQSVIDVDARNGAGIKPIESFLAMINAAENETELADAAGQIGRVGVYGPLAPYVGVDAKKSDQYTVYLTQSGLTLPDRDYYIEKDERYVELRGKLKKYVYEMLSQFSDPTEEQVAAILEIEKTIAKAQWSKTENRDPEKTYNAFSAGEIAERLKPLGWEAYANASEIADHDKFVLRQPSYADALVDLVRETELEDWKAYFCFHVIDAYASELSEDLEKRHFAFHSTAVRGVTEQEPLWKRAVNTTNAVLGELVGQVYVDKHFKPAAKEQMNELVENLKKAFDKRIRSRDWMGEGTKKQALQKLGLFTTKIGYPDKWKDYSNLIIQPQVLAQNVIASAKFEHQRELDKLGGPIDRTEWHMTPQTINAYYNPTMNEIVFPAAILQPPFFNMSADDAVNYGAIGAVIGHELSHGFDDKGSKYDGNGNLRMWWTQEDRSEFEERATELSKQYGEFEPVPGNYVNGELTLGENIGDLGGLSVAYEAYRLSLEGKAAEVIDGLTGDQRFFLGWAQIWRRLYREQELLKRLVTDPHSPSEFRVNGIVRNMDAWYDAFQIKPGAPLYLAPQDRVRIW